MITVVDLPQFSFCVETITAYRYNVDMFQNILKKKNLSVYQCSKLSGIPYSTLFDIINNKTTIEKCTAATAYNLARVLGVTVETLLNISYALQDDFEVFKSNVKHRIKADGDLKFIMEVLQNKEIEEYWNKDKKTKALYLIATVDYLSRINDLPKVNTFDEYRTYRLEEVLWPEDVEMLGKYMSKEYKKELYDNAIPEFLNFNIVEGDLRDTV